MPLRSDLLTKRFSTFELTILPFLAPRVFTPWPSNRRRAHTGTQDVQKPHTIEKNYDNWPSKVEEAERCRKKQDFVLRRLAKNSTKKATDRESKISGKSLEDIDNLYDTNIGLAKDSSSTSVETLLGNSFCRKYEEIWGVNKLPPSDGRMLRAETGGETEDISDSLGPHQVAQGVRSKSRRREKFQQFHHGRVLDAIKYRRDAERKTKMCSHREAHAPIKIVRWNPTQRSVLSWQKRFAIINLRHENVGEGRKPPSIVAFRKRMTNQTFWESLIGNDSSTSLHKAWNALPVQRRRDIWPELMLITLDEQPTKALKFLIATYEDPYPSGQAVSDSFDYIISYYLRNQKVQNPKNALGIFRVFERMLRLGPRGYFHLSQSSIYLLLKNLDDRFSGILFQTLVKYDHPLHKNTLMHFPAKLRLSGGPDERLDILMRLRRQGSDFNSPEMCSVCATLLLRKNRSSEVSHSDSEIFEFMLECGLKPNIVIYNILLQNSLEAGDHETGWQIHDIIVESGIEPDPYTYSILLWNAKIRNDRRSVERIIKIFTEKATRNAHIATDLLHTIFVLHENYDMSPHLEQDGQPAKTFERMLSVYCKYFQVESLAHIIPWFKGSYSNTTHLIELENTGSASASKSVLMDAPVPTLVVMLSALLRDLTDPALIIRFYNHFHGLVKTGDPIATALSKSTHVYNITLQALGSFPETLALCPRLIGDMLSPSLAPPEAFETTQSVVTNEKQSSSPASTPLHDGSDNQITLSQTQSLSEVKPSGVSIDQASGIQAGRVAMTPSSMNQRRLHPRPDVHTWSVLLKAFMDHWQPRAAEKVLTMMRDRGVYPNQVTWNSLIIGYARMQDMSMTVDAVNRLQKGGFDLDGVTMKGLAYFQNRRALIEAMRASEAGDPQRSLKKRPAWAGMAHTNLQKMLRLVKDTDKLDGFGPDDINEMDVDVDVDDARGTEEPESEAAASFGLEDELVVRDIPRV